MHTSSLVLPGFWTCADGVMMITERDVCDTHPDCVDSSDELNCEQYNCSVGMWKCKNELQCIRNTSVCDGYPRCEDNSDEERSLCESWNCTSGHIKFEGKISLSFCSHILAVISEYLPRQSVLFSLLFLNSVFRHYSLNFASEFGLEPQMRKHILGC